MWLSSSAVCAVRTLMFPKRVSKKSLKVIRCLWIQNSSLPSFTLLLASSQSTSSLCDTRDIGHTCSSWKAIFGILFLLFQLNSNTSPNWMKWLHEKLLRVRHGGGHNISTRQTSGKHSHGEQPSTAHRQSFKANTEAWEEQPRSSLQKTKGFKSQCYWFNTCCGQPRVLNSRGAPLPVRRIEPSLAVFGDVLLTTAWKVLSGFDWSVDLPWPWKGNSACCQTQTSYHRINQSALSHLELSADSWASSTGTLICHCWPTACQSGCLPVVRLEPPTLGFRVSGLSKWATYLLLGNISWAFYHLFCHSVHVSCQHDQN